MIPLTFAGMGTRDTAFILLFSKFYEPSLMVSFGMLFSLRYFLPGLIGLIWLRKYVSGEKKNGKNHKVDTL